MRRFIKIVGTFVLLLVVGVIAVLALLPSEKIAQLAADQVKSATGRDLTITGKVSPSFFPVLGVETGSVALSNADWGAADKMVTASSAKIGVELWPLISGIINVSEIRLVDPVIALEVNESGQGNWVFASAADPAPQADAGGESFVKELSLGEAVIENGTVSYTDATTGQALRVEAINATVALAALDQPLTADGSALWNGQTAALSLFLETPAAAMAGQAIDLKLDLSSDPVSLAYEGSIAPPADGQPPVVKGSFSVESADPAAAAMWATGAPAPDALAGITDLSLSGEADLGPTAATLAANGSATRGGQVAKLDLKAAGDADWVSRMALDVDLSASIGSLATVKYVGGVAPSEGVVPVALTGRYDLTASDPSAAVAWATGAAPDALNGMSALNFAGQIDLGDKGLSATAKGGLSRDGARALIDLDAKSGANWASSRAFDLTLKAALEGLADANFAGSVAVPDGAAPTVNGQISINAPDLKRLADFAGTALPAGGPGAFQRLAMTGSVSTPGANQIALNLASLTFDDIQATGTVAANYGGTPSVSANLNAGALDLTPYIVGQESGPSGPGWSKERIDLSALGSLSGDFAIRAASVTLPQLKLGQSDIAAKLNNGRLDLTIRELGLYGGGLKGDIAVDGRNNNTVAANISVGAVKLLPLLKALADMDAVRGLGQMNLNVTGSGASLHDIMNSLNGQGGLKLEDGALVGYDLAGMVRNVTSAFTGGNTGAQETDFSEVGGTFTIRQGVLSNADFAFLGPLIRIVGEGTVDLGGQAVNFRLTPKAVASLTGQGGALDDKGISFPIIISGPWSNLSFRPDLQAGITNLLEDPDAAIDTVKGIVDSVKEGGTAGAAAGVLGAITGDGAKGGAGSVIEQLTGQSGSFNKTEALKAARAELDAARAAGDRKRARAAKDEFDRIKALPDNDPAVDAVGGLIKGILKKN